MPTRFRHAVLVGKHQSQGIRPVLETIARCLLDRGLEVSLGRQTAANTGMSQFEALSSEEMGRRCDLAVVVGGDGTMLGIARELAPYGLPLVGINQGRFGFITDVPFDRFAETLGAMVEGEYVEERRAMLESEVWRDGVRLAGGPSMNDAVVSRGAPAAMIELRVDIGDELVAHLRADGLIVASPTGSTAYALSAGGPILHPELAGWVLAPIAPHTLSNRPIVLPDAGEIRIGIVAGREAGVNLDAQFLVAVQIGDQVRVRRAPQQVRFLHPLGWSYYATLRRKLRWHEGGD